jgi:hypothetical protein
MDDAADAADDAADAIDGAIDAMDDAADDVIDVALLTLASAGAPPCRRFFFNDNETESRGSTMSLSDDDATIEAGKERRQGWLTGCAHDGNLG